jgi:hypothetical protein
MGAIVIVLAHGGTNGWWAHHGVHSIMLLGPVAVLALIALTSDVRGRLEQSEQSERVESRQLPPFILAAALSLLAAAVHLIVCPEHFQESVMYGGFFAATTAAQFAWSFLVVRRPSRWLLLSGVLGSCALIGLWAVSRTVGIPFGPASGQIEPVGALDLTATASELGVVLLVSWSLLAHRARRTYADTLTAYTTL